MKILFLGDVCPTPDYLKLFEDKSGKSLFNNVSALIKECDYAVCNFECPATNSQTPIKKCGPTLKAKPEDIEMLSNVGISAVSLANNHTLDYGVTGFLDTVSACEKFGVSYFGTVVDGKDNEQVTFIKDGEKVKVLSFAEEEFNYSDCDKTGAIHFDPYESLDKIAKAKEDGAKVVVLYHGGIEYYRYPSPLLKKKCQKMVEKGADLVLCQHSHIIGTEQISEKGVILYGQGNSVFGFRENSSTWNKGLAVIYDTEKGVEYKLITASEKGVKIADGDETEKVLQDIKAQSDKLTDEFINVEWQKFCAQKADLYYPMALGKGRVYNKANRLSKGKLVGAIGGGKKMTVMNLIRCDAHREVLTTVLEKDYEKFTK